MSIISLAGGQGTTLATLRVWNHLQTKKPLALIPGKGKVPQPVTKMGYRKIVQELVAIAHGRRRPGYWKKRIA